MVVESKYYVIGIYDEASDCIYYYKERDGDELVCTPFIDAAEKTKSLAVEDCHVENLVWWAYGLIRSGEIAVVRYGEQIEERFIFKDEAKFLNAISINSVVATCRITKVRRR